MIVLSKSDDDGRDHLIHRKRSPFPYEGKALPRLKVGVIANVEQLRLSQTSSTANAVPLLLQGEGLSARLLRRACRYRAPKRPTFAVTPTFTRANTFPYEGKGDRVSGG